MNLGQVFTKLPVAEYMVSLFTIDKNGEILDPCFGKGVFLTALINSGWNRVCGYEIDPILYKKCKNKYHDFTLKNNDFLTADPTKKYDGIIMNPPYIRHEKINELSQLGVNKEILAANPIFAFLPPTANMYMYFIIKAISILKQNGELIVIFPSSWLLAKNGDHFKKVLYKNCIVERQIHISGNVFEKNALVDVIILKLKKTTGKKIIQPEHIKLTDNSFIPMENNNKLQIAFPKRYGDIGKIRRGLTTGCNEMFINPDINDATKYTTPIISSPKQVIGYTTKDAMCDKLLVIDNDYICDANIAKYIHLWKERFLKKGRPETFVKKINNGEKWYKLNTFESDGIIFSYIIRNDMKFIFNKSGKIVRDNFYVLYPSIDPWICFALLNSYYTYYQLECSGKKYGAGLLKIQKYDVENLQFPDFETFSNEDTTLLKHLAKELANTCKKDVIAEITKVLSHYSDISYEEITNEYKNIVIRRLENK